jgi:predicted TIM-barrel fold metal-dependent hydrolase
LVLTGILERHPKLKVALVETGSGWIPYYMEQIDDAYFRNRTHPPFAQLTMPPSDYLRRQMWTTIMVDTFAIKNRYAIGVDRIMWSSDYPHSGYGSEWPSSRLFIEQQFRGVPEPELRRMLGENCAELFGVPAAPSTRPGSLH